MSEYPHRGFSLGATVTNIPHSGKTFPESFDIVVIQLNGLNKLIGKEYVKYLFSSFLKCKICPNYKKNPHNHSGITCSGIITGRDFSYIMSGKLMNNDEWTEIIQSNALNCRPDIKFENK